MENSKSQNGFTVMELAFVILIAGMVMSFLLGALATYNAARDKEQTQESLSLSEAALFEFKAMYGYYPCPADPTPESASEYGRADCLNTTLALGRDANDDGLPDEVLIGAVPFATLLDPNGDGNGDDGIQSVKLTSGKTLDGWGRKLSYAISKNLTSTGTYSDLLGAIDIIDENRQSMLQTPGNAHLALVSHGLNGRGAFMENGTKVEDCVNGIEEGPKYSDYLLGLLDALTPDFGGGGGGGLENSDPGLDPGIGDIGGGLGGGLAGDSPGGGIGNSGGGGNLLPGHGGGGGPVIIDPNNGVGVVDDEEVDVVTGPSETENCDNDAEFVAGLYSEGDDYNDDFVSYMNTISSNLWEYSGGTTRIVNTNTGYVGVGIDTPQSELHVAGDIKATKVIANTYCPENGRISGLCMEADVLGGNKPEMRCAGRNRAVEYIERNAVHCVEDVFMAPADAIADGQTMLCEPGLVVQGISNVTGVICGEPPPFLEDVPPPGG